VRADIAIKDGMIAEIGKVSGGAQRTTQTFLIDLEKPAQEPRQLFTRNAQDRYRDPGSPMTKGLPSGGRDPRLPSVGLAAGIASQVLSAAG